MSGGARARARRRVGRADSRCRRRQSASASRGTNVVVVALFGPRAVPDVAGERAHLLRGSVKDSRFLFLSLSFSLALSFDSHESTTRERFAYALELVTPSRLA